MISRNFLAFNIDPSPVQVKDSVSVYSDRDSNRDRDQKNIQGVSFEILQFQMVVAQKLYIFDPMLVKPKCV